VDRDDTNVLDAVRPVTRQLGIEINLVLVTPEHLAAGTRRPLAGDPGSGPVEDEARWVVG
jgi:hypothetical protein